MATAKTVIPVSLELGVGPMLETLAPLLPVVGHFEANAVRITEEYRPIVGGIFREVARFADINPGMLQHSSGSGDIGHGFNPEA